ncbi:MAG: hypothetical protein RBU45_18610, partial [Myxococcota bacterium]|nr:hypothetical protein [Myxococcota bacterium]
MARRAARTGPARTTAPGPPPSGPSASPSSAREPSSAAPAPAPLAEEGWWTAWRDPLAWLLVLLLTLLFATLKTYGLRPDLGDEGIYFYVALATAQG